MDDESNSSQHSGDGEYLRGIFEHNEIDAACDEFPYEQVEYLEYDILDGSATNVISPTEIPATTKKPRKKMYVKKTRIVLTLHQKKEILTMIHDPNMSYKKISEETGVPINSIKTIKRSEASILQEFSNNRHVSKARKKLRHSSHRELEAAMLTWVYQCRTTKSIISTEMMQAQAQMFHEELCKLPRCTFSSSQGWCTRFKEKHGIRQLQIAGESLSADLTKVDQCKGK